MTKSIQYQYIEYQLELHSNRCAIICKCGNKKLIELKQSGKTIKEIITVLYPGPFHIPL